MPIRTDDLHAPFLAALKAIGHPAELHEIAKWINENAPLDRGRVKNDGTLGRARDNLEAAGLIERDVTKRRYKLADRKVTHKPRAAKPASCSACGSVIT